MKGSSLGGKTLNSVTEMRVNQGGKKLEEDSPLQGAQKSAEPE